MPYRPPTVIPWTTGHRNISFDDVGVIQAALNGDIDNYQELKAAFEQDGIQIPADISTDTKIIPLQIHKFLKSGMKIEDAFRQAVNTFKGSHAIFMTTDLAPGKLFLAQKGSGQTIFVGLCEEYYMPVSEVYGFVEDTHRFLKMDGEKVVEGPAGRTQGQIFILDQDSGGSVSEIKAMYYNGVADNPWLNPMSKPPRSPPETLTARISPIIF